MAVAAAGGEPEFVNLETGEIVGRAENWSQCYRDRRTVAVSRDYGAIEAAIRPTLSLLNMG